MVIRKLVNVFLFTTLVISLLIGGNTQALAKDNPPPPKKDKESRENLKKLRFSHKDRVEAAKRAADARMELPKLGEDALASEFDSTMAMDMPGMPGEAPHYFGPYANYANSPLRMADVMIHLMGDGTGAEASATVDPATGEITAIEVTSPGSGYTTAPMVMIDSPVGEGTGAAAETVIDAAGTVTAVNVLSGGTGYMTPGIRKFVDGLPGLNAGSANNLGQYIPVAVADTTTYPDADYYEIAVVEYEEQMHSDLPPTTLRGYVQLSTSVVPGAHVALTNPDGSAITLPDGSQAYGVDKAHYLGPLISATKDRPVRILFRNLLPTGEGGDLFLPVDVTVMGSGMGPGMDGMHEMDPQNPMCSMQPKPMDCYKENRATLHLHGGLSPWISDGTPHQWVTPANEDTPYPEGVSVTNVPDMPDPGPGAMTFFYTNQQSARLMFYHDHSWGITRLNVYAGEAAGYLITDPTEQKLIADGVIPADQIPLIVQDKTFVPSDAQLSMTDPLWDTTRWGAYGDLWMPHVYVPAQNPGDSSGVNQFGRWAYGPWFWPPTNSILYPPIANPYYDPNCNPDLQWCEPELIPGTPYNSMGMEAFQDTPVINGTAYPVLEVQPKSYRFRVLNAANDRFFNLSLYQAIDANGVVCDSANTNPTPELSGVTCTEVRLNDVEAALEDQTIFPTPDQATAGPEWIQIATEGGFLPAPAVIPAHPTTWVNDPTVFNAGNVDLHSLLIGPAERADVIVDFSQFAGQTLILYNDAPAAFPARDPRYDYYTGSADLTETGGAPSISAGYGPNTRTMMQIKVAAAAPAPTYDLAALQAAFTHKADGSGVFEQSQNPIIVGQGAYNSAYGTSFFTNGPRAGLVQIFSENLTFDTVAGGQLTMPLQRKAIQDEMGEAFDPEYGRMSGNLGLEAPNVQAGTQQKLILYPYVNPATEIVDGLEIPGLEVTPINTTDDGTQLWKITHNGVDTHPIHFHLYDVQLINRVGWDGIIRRPEPNELGWKDTVRVSPLEDTIVAFRPVLPKVPFGVPDSIRPLNPMMPIGSTEMFNSTDAFGNPMNPPITNQIVNFGWEYVWHCHILSHEEMDMMRPISVAVSRELPAAPVVSLSRAGSTVTLTWQDTTPMNYADPASWGNPASEIGYRVERAPWVSGQTPVYEVIHTNLSNQAGFVDTTAQANQGYTYRVVAFNAAGDSPSAPVESLVLQPPAAPANVVATAQAGPQINVTWQDLSNNETNFIVERSVNNGAFTQVATPTGTSFLDTAVAFGSSYRYRVAATNAAGTSTFVTSNTVTLTATRPSAPSNASATFQTGPQITFTFRDNATNEDSFTVQRSVNGGTWTTLTTLPARAGTGNVSHIDTTVVPGNSYRYRVAAVNAAGASAYATSNTVTVAGPPAAPTNAVATVISGTQVTLTFSDNSSNETGFVIERSVDGGAFAALTTGPSFTGTGTRTFNDNTVTAGHTYTYRVAARNTAGTSAFATSNTVTTPTTPIGPAAPTNPVATQVSTTRIDFSFMDNSTNETSFLLERSVDGGAFALLSTGPSFTGTGLRTYQDTTVTAGHSYTYRVAARNANGTSAYATSNTVTIAGAPAAPSNLTGTAEASGTTATISLTWTDNANNETSFVLQRATNSTFSAGVQNTTILANQTSAQQTGLARGVRYYFRIRAVSNGSNSAWSNNFNILTP